MTHRGEQPRELFLNLVGGLAVRRFDGGRLVVVAAVSCVLFASACSSDGTPKDDLQIVAHPVAATPAVSPVPAVKPQGEVLALSAPITALVSDEQTRVLAVATDNPPSIQLRSLDDLHAQPRIIPLPGRAENLTAADGKVLVSLPNQQKLIRIDVASGATTEIPVDGQPAAAYPVDGQTLVAVPDRKAVEVLGDGNSRKTITGGLYSADELANAGSSTVVLDRLRSAVFSVDVAAGKINAGLPAGDGATNMTADSFGRVLVTDTRMSTLLAFSADPLILRQRYPVPGGIYGVAWDAKRDLAWVTLTERNEIVGFDMRGGEPVEKYRFSSVRQPNTITVDENSSEVIVGSATGEGIQVIKP
jgi:hypothetical protein